MKKALLQGEDLNKETIRISMVDQDLNQRYQENISIAIKERYFEKI